MTLQNMGVNARSFMGWQLVRRRASTAMRGSTRSRRDARRGAERRHGRGHPRLPGRRDRRPRRDARPRRLGHVGGGDRRGVKADRCDIYTDVDGVYTTDPRIVPQGAQARPITFEEMLELAGVGAKVLQTARSGSRCARICRCACCRRSRTSPDRVVAELSGATWNETHRRHRRRPQRGAGHADRRPDRRARSRGDRPLAEAGIQVDMIVHAATPTRRSSDLTFTVPRASLPRRWR
jgi:aspartate kinase